MADAKSLLVAGDTTPLTKEATTAGEQLPRISFTSPSAPIGCDPHSSPSTLTFCTTSPINEDLKKDTTQGLGHAEQRPALAHRDANLAPPKPETQTQKQTQTLRKPIPAMEAFRRDWYKDWFRDHSVEKADPFGFSSAGTSTAASRNISRTGSPQPPACGNYETARRASLGG
ncbi:hypothetical protein K432DRAFT_216850 [Lepidopterella palustris CBS 459.81]|uniref:Uncharacterized protein n=1 Tax=Lepidopterella palustris CBS 459.81 TaxID=1314670 RepID=A0A8E2JKI8_9PEZI|nr:hypothetical protein K432DRAFT_216850 [Lepidopterella palustris CBS 459.81]